MVGSYSKKDIRSLKQITLTGNETATTTMASATDTQVVELACPASKVTVQSTGDLAFSWAVSINGEDFVSVGAVAAGVLSSYNTHLVSTVQITWTSGSGKVVIASVS
jgi:hypothetical protein